MKDIMARLFSYYLTGLVIVLGVSFITIFPLLSPGFFPMHDDTQVGRVVVMGRALRRGQFPVRWVSDLGYGYGYPLYNFYGPLPYYVGGALYGAGIQGLQATKFMFLLGILGAAGTMYVLVARYYGRLSGIVAGAAYAFAPYHAVQIYVRGAVGEFWVLVFLPIVLLGVALCSQKRHQSVGVLIGSLGLAGTILSHTILGYVTVFGLDSGLLCYWIILLVRRRFSLSIVRSQLALVSLGLLLSTFFWLPAMAEMAYTNVAGQISASADYHNHFVCPSQLWNSLWGYGGSAPGCIDGMSFKVGKIHIVLGTLSIVAVLLTWKKAKKTVGLWIVAAGITMLSILFALPVSTALWEHIPLFAFVQYPWRFLTYTAFGISLLAGILMSLIASRRYRVLAVGVALVGIVFTNMKLFTPQYTYIRPPMDFESEHELQYRVSKISDEYLPKDFLRPKDSGGIAHDTIAAGKIQSQKILVDTGIYAKFLVETQKPETITIQRTFFPGWTYRVDGTEVIPKIVSGLPTISIEGSQHVIEIMFTDTPVRRIANSISLVTMLGILFYYGKKAYT